MAIESVNINAGVGTRKGKAPLPNQPADIATICDLFDRIPVVNGGTAGIAGPWPVERGALIAAVTRQIAIFQSTNPSAGSDSTIAPSGSALRIMNRLAADSPPQAIVDPWPESVGLDDMTQLTYFAGIHSMPGSGPLLPDFKVTHYTRHLIRATGTSIKWFATVVPESVGATVASAVPHIFFYSDADSGRIQRSNLRFFPWLGTAMVRLHLAHRRTFDRVWRQSDPRHSALQDEPGVRPRLLFEKLAAGRHSRRHRRCECNQSVLSVDPLHLRTPLFIELQ